MTKHCRVEKINVILELVSYCSSSKCVRKYRIGVEYIAIKINQECREVADSECLHNHRDFLLTIHEKTIEITKNIEEEENSYHFLEISIDHLCVFPITGLAG